MSTGNLFRLIFAYFCLLAAFALYFFSPNMYAQLALIVVGFVVLITASTRRRRHAATVEVVEVERKEEPESPKKFLSKKQKKKEFTKREAEDLRQLETVWKEVEEE